MGQLCYSTALCWPHASQEKDAHVVMLNFHPKIHPNQCNCGSGVDSLYNLPDSPLVIPDVWPLKALHWVSLYSIQRYVPILECLLVFISVDNNIIRIYLGQCHIVTTYEYFYGTQNNKSKHKEYSDVLMKLNSVTDESCHLALLLASNSPISLRALQL